MLGRHTAHTTARETAVMDMGRLDRNMPILKLKIIVFKEVKVGGYR